MQEKSGEVRLSVCVSWHDAVPSVVEYLLRLVVHWVSGESDGLRVFDPSEGSCFMRVHLQRRITALEHLGLKVAHRLFATEAG